jgi:hypothetical protein
MARLVLTPRPDGQALPAGVFTMSDMLQLVVNIMDTQVMILRNVAH